MRLSAPMIEAACGADGSSRKASSARVPLRVSAVSREPFDTSRSAERSSNFSASSLSIAAAEMLGDRLFHMGENGERRHRRPHGEEFAGSELAQAVGLLRRETEQIGGARNVAVEDVEADEEVLQLGDHRGGELGEALGGDNRCDAALAATGAEVGERGDAEAAGLRVAGRSRMMRREQMALVDADEDGVAPMLARRADQAGEQGRRLDDALVGIKVGEIDMEREPVLAGARGRCRQAVRGEFAAFERGRADMGCEIAEFAFGINQHDGREVERLLDDLAQGPALAGAAAALDEQPAGEQALEVEHERAAAVLADRHGPLVGGWVDR
jgi:hypothetical protein